MAKNSNRNLILLRVQSTVPFYSDRSNDRQTVFVTLEWNKAENEAHLNYLPGDHLGVFPENDPQLVDNIIQHLDYLDTNTVYKVLIRKSQESENDEEFVLNDNLRSCSIKEALIRYFDITTPPSQHFLSLISKFCKDQSELSILEALVNDHETYEEWKTLKHPNFFELLSEFPSLRPPAELLLTQLPNLQPRFYSISSSQQYLSQVNYSHQLIKKSNIFCTNIQPFSKSMINNSCNNALSPKLSQRKQEKIPIDLTVAVVNYRTQANKLHFGVCSNFLANVKQGQQVFGFIRSAPNFRMPEDISIPIILVGPGTGIAPFRAFWLQRYALFLSNPSLRSQFGKITLFFGCKVPSMQLYSQEIDKMLEEEIISQLYVAYSRVAGQPKVSAK